MHQLDAENLIDPGSDGIPSWVPLQPIVDLTFVTDGDELPLGSGIWTVLHSPGHSMGSVCFYNAKEGLLISGDTLFKGTMGNISFPTSAPDLMADTLVRLSSLPAATKIFPGHGSASTIGDERSWMVSAAQKLRNLS